MIIEGGGAHLTQKERDALQADITAGLSRMTIIEKYHISASVYQYHKKLVAGVNPSSYDYNKVMKERQELEEQNAALQKKINELVVYKGTVENKRPKPSERIKDVAHTYRFKTDMFECDIDVNKRIATIAFEALASLNQAQLKCLIEDLTYLQHAFLDSQN